MQQAELSIELGSFTETNLFLALLAATKNPFDVSIKTCCRVTRSFMENFIKDITSAGTVVLARSMDSPRRPQLRPSTKSIGTQCLIRRVNLQKFIQITCSSPRQCCTPDHYEDFRRISQVWNMTKRSSELCRPTPCYGNSMSLIKDMMHSTTPSISPGCGRVCQVPSVSMS